MRSLLKRKPSTIVSPETAVYDAANQMAESRKALLIVCIVRLGDRVQEMSTSEKRSQRIDVVEMTSFRCLETPVCCLVISPESVSGMDTLV